MVFPNPLDRQVNSYPHERQHMMVDPSFTKRSTPTGMQSLLQPENMSHMATRGAISLSKFLGNAQQVLKVIETAAPIVQEYGPMIKNIPALYRMMKAVNEIDSSESETEEHKTDIKTTEHIDQDEKQSNSESVKIPKQQQHERTGVSKPLLFI